MTLGSQPLSMTMMSVEKLYEKYEYTRLPPGASFPLRCRMTEDLLLLPGRWKVEAGPNHN